LAGGRIVAVLAARGELDAIARARLLLGDSGLWLAIATNNALLLLESVSARKALDMLLSLASRADIAALIAQGAICVEGAFFLRSGAFARLATCSLSGLSRQALITGQPPTPSRRVPEAVLYAYESRLLRDGNSPERLAAKIATSAGGVGAGVLALEAQKRPRVILAASNRARLCITHLGSAALAVLEKGEGIEPGCRSDAVARLEPLRRAIRVMHWGIDRILYT